MSFLRPALWPGMVFGFIGMNVCVVGITVYAANTDRSSFAIEPDYDRKALHWDETAARERLYRSLGWSIRIDSTEGGRLLVSVLDRAGRALEGVEVAVEAFHHAQARNRVVAKLRPALDGGYEAPLGVPGPGLWEYRFTARRGADTFVSTMTRSEGTQLQ